jgi:hypothetical protein
MPVSLLEERTFAEESTGEDADVIVYASSTATETSVASILTPGCPSFWVSDCFPDSFIAFDFGDEPVWLCQYDLLFPELPIEKYRHQFLPREVKLEVSMDDNNWTLLDQRSLDCPRGNSVPKFAFQIPPAKSTHIARYVRISQVGLNHGGTHTFAVKHVALFSQPLSSSPMEDWS